MRPDLAAVAAGYLLGAIPFAYLLARGLGGVDVRKVGSGNVGATNVLRATRARTALLVTVLDVAKGAAAVWAADTIGAGPSGRVLAGLAAIIGHVHPVWLGFRGGKGVATACGVFAVLAPPATAMALAVFVAAVWGTGYVSMGSVSALIALPLAAWAAGEALVVVAGASAACALVLFTHRSNLARWRAGTEPRIGQRA
jgi:glycerol-3-phosphate acyltransferase PlsY